MHTIPARSQTSWNAPVPGLKFASLLCLAGIAALLGTASALLGGFIAVIIFVVLALSAVTLWNYRIGILFVVLFYPLSAVYFFPREVLGITGLNPLNLLFVLVIGSFCLSRLFRKNPIWIFPNGWMVVFIVMFLIAGIFGMLHVQDISPSYFFAKNPPAFGTRLGYLAEFVIKPMQLVGTAWLLAHAVVESRSADRYAYIVAFSMLPLVAVVLVAFVASGLPLSAISTASNRAFLEFTGYHANSLGFMFSMAFALLLFMQGELRNTPRTRILIHLILAVTVFALILTFSRAAFVLAFVVLAVFVGSRMRSASGVWALIAVGVVFAALPDEVWLRLSEGFGERSSLTPTYQDKLSAGRVAMWVSLLPDILQSPIWGHGIGSITWSNAVRNSAFPLTTMAHSAYVTALLDTGVVGLLVTLGFYYWVWRELRQISKNSEVSPALRSFFAGSAAGLLGFSVAAVTNLSFYPTIEQSGLWFAIGLLFGVKGRLGMKGR